jgi:hypothetical protein
MDSFDIPAWWDGAGRYWISNGTQQRHVGYCRCVEELVAAVMSEETDGFDLHGAIIIRLRSKPRAEMTYEQWLASHLPDLLLDD